MAHGTINYAAAFFQFKTPTYIQGIPTNKSLKKLKTELRANASSVESDLGGETTDIWDSFCLQPSKLTSACLLHLSYLQLTQAH